MESDPCRRAKWSSLWWYCSCGLVSKQLGMGRDRVGMKEQNSGKVGGIKGNERDRREELLIGVIGGR